jgi:hypothetical protein
MNQNYTKLELTSLKLSSLINLLGNNYISSNEAGYVKHEMLPGSRQTKDLRYSRLYFIKSILNNEPLSEFIYFSWKKDGFRNITRGIELAETLFNFLPDHPANPKDPFYLDLRNGDINIYSKEKLVSSHDFLIFSGLNSYEIVKKERELEQLKQLNYTESERCLNNLWSLETTLREYPTFYYAKLFNEY